MRHILYSNTVLTSELCCYVITQADDSNFRHKLQLTPLPRYRIVVLSDKGSRKFRYAPQIAP
jgi:hypothetical protein